ncbi:hypothetical protein ElyMa_000662700, partial [Elysia marginata]
ISERKELKRLRTEAHSPKPSLNPLSLPCLPDINQDNCSGSNVKPEPTEHETICTGGFSGAHSKPSSQNFESSASLANLGETVRKKKDHEVLGSLLSVAPAKIPSQSNIEKFSDGLVLPEI